MMSTSCELNTIGLGALPNGYFEHVSQRHTERVIDAANDYILSHLSFLPKVNRAAVHNMGSLVLDPRFPTFKGLKAFAEGNKIEDRFWVRARSHFESSWGFGFKPKPLQSRPDEMKQSTA